MNKIATWITRIALVLAGSVVASRAQDSPPAPAGESLAIVVHKSNPVENVTTAELRKLCRAERNHWSNGRRVTVALREPGQAERTAVLKSVYGFTEEDFQRHFLQSTFTGEVQSAPKQLATASGMRRFVFNVPGAIAFVRVSEVDDSVKVLRLDGLEPKHGRYSLKVAAK